MHLDIDGHDYQIYAIAEGYGCIWQPFQTKNPNNAMLIRWFEEKHNVNMRIWTFFWSTEKNGIALDHIEILDQIGSICLHFAASWPPSRRFNIHPISWLVAFLRCSKKFARAEVIGGQSHAFNVSDGMAMCREISSEKVGIDETRGISARLTSEKLHCLHA